MSKSEQLKKNISSLEGELKGLDESLELNINDLLPPVDMLNGINDIQVFDYDNELKEIQTDCIETLECLSTLYLRVEDIESKNIQNIIKNDANALADLKFTLSCSKRGMVNLMKNIDLGLNDPELYKSLALIQKEIRDTIKLVFDIQKKMKDFYKEVKNELKEINKGDSENDNIQDIENITDDNQSYVILDMEKMYNELEEYKNKNNDIN